MHIKKINIMKHFYILLIIVLLFIISCARDKGNEKVIKKSEDNKSVVLNNDLLIKLKEFIIKNPLDYSKEQVYLINFCFSNNNDTLLFFHKTFFTDSYFTGFNFIEQKGWFKDDDNIIIVIDYKNIPIGRKLYNQDYLLKLPIDKEKTKRHTGLLSYTEINEFLVINNKIFDSNSKGTVILGEKIFRCYDKQVKNKIIIKD